MILETVAHESTTNPTYSDAQVIKDLLISNKIKSIPVIATPVDGIIDGYTKLGKGERDTIRLAITNANARIVLDDYLAFVISTRFGVNPILLLDLLVAFVKENYLSVGTCLEIVARISARYSPPFIEHTRYKLNEVEP